MLENCNTFLFLNEYKTAINFNYNQHASVILWVIKIDHFSTRSS